jgi:CRP-like cAMP-binding protein
LLKSLHIEWPRPSGGSAAKLFLSHFKADDRAHIERQLETLSVVRGECLVTARDPGEFVYFSQGPLISLQLGGRAEVALVGSEGLIGWPSLVGCKGSPYSAFVGGRDGTVSKLRSEVLLTIMAQRPSVRLTIDRFVNSINLQMAETIGAFAMNRIEVRLARWLLLRHDRVNGDEIAVQHDEIAKKLSTRRASITDCLHLIEGDGLLRCRRGRVTIRDRAGLEDLAVGCYGAAEILYRDTIGSFGKSAVDARLAVAA